MSALNEQVGGNHYKKYAVQPAEYIIKNGLGFAEGRVVKYVTCWKDKNGVEDLKKARHFLDLLIELSSPDTPEDAGNSAPTHGEEPVLPVPRKFSMADYYNLAKNYDETGAVAFVVLDHNNWHQGFKDEDTLLAYLRGHNDSLTVLTRSPHLVCTKMAGDIRNQVIESDWHAGPYKAMRSLPRAESTNGN